MVDIVDELRKVGQLQGDTYSSYEILGMVRQAREEIERLRAQDHKLQQVIQSQAIENGRLRTALRIAREAMRCNIGDGVFMHELEEVEAALSNEQQARKATWASDHELKIDEP